MKKKKKPIIETESITEQLETENSPTLLTSEMLDKQRNVADGSWFMSRWIQRERGEEHRQEAGDLNAHPAQEVVVDSRRATKGTLQVNPQAGKNADDDGQVAHIRKMITIENRDQNDDVNPWV